MMLCIRRSRKVASTRIRLFPKRLAYLRSQCILCMSLAQFLLGIGIIGLQVLLMRFMPTLLPDELVVYKTANSYSPGIWIAGLQMIGAGLTILVAVEPVYFWVHFAMTFNAMGLIGNFMACLCLLCFALPEMAVVVNTIASGHVIFGLAPHSEEAADFARSFNCLIIMAATSIASLGVGSFLAAATGFPIFCVFNKSGTHKISPRTSSCGTGLKTRQVNASQLQSPPITPTPNTEMAFDPTNVAANLNFNVERSVSMENVPI